MIATQALEALGLAAAIVARDGRILGTNNKFDSMQGKAPLVAFDRIAFVNPGLNQALQNSLNAIARGNQRGVTSIAVPALANRHAFIAHMLPIKKVAVDVLDAPLAIVIIAPISAATPIDGSLLQALFDLTPAEASLARSLQQGESLAAIAKQSGLTTATLRSRLKAVFHKTGVHRQGELIALLSGLSI